MQAALKAGLSDSEIQELLKLSTAKEIKEKLKSSTQDALDYGVSCSHSCSYEEISSLKFCFSIHFFLVTSCLFSCKNVKMRVKCMKNSATL